MTPVTEPTLPTTVVALIFAGCTFRKSTTGLEIHFSFLLKDESLCSSFGGDSIHVFKVICRIYKTKSLKIMQVL